MLKESWKNILLGALLLTGLTMLLGSDSSDKKQTRCSLCLRQKPPLCLPMSRNI